MTSHISSKFDFQDKVQQPGRTPQAIFQTQPKIYYKKLLIPVGVVAAIVAIVGLLSFEQWQHSSWDLVMLMTTTIAALTAVGCLGGVLQAWLDYSGVTYILTSNYAITKRHGFRKSLAQVDLTEVGPVFVNSKGLDRFFGVGTIELSIPKLALTEPPLRKTLARWNLATGLGGLIVTYALRHHYDNTIAMKLKYVENPDEVYALLRKTIANARKG